MQKDNLILGMLIIFSAAALLLLAHMVYLCLTALNSMATMP